jgi:salicylate hydroxylase
LQHRDQVSRLLTAYDEIRQPRCALAHEYEHWQQLLLKAPIGPLQVMRDDALQKTLVHKKGEHMDEDSFREAWGIELMLFAHDATDKVKDWWGQWGYMIAKGHSVPGASIHVCISKKIKVESSRLVW